jgi:hypothetical protein
MTEHVHGPLGKPFPVQIGRGSGGHRRAHPPTIGPAQAAAGSGPRAPPLEHRVAAAIRAAGAGRQAQAAAALSARRPPLTLKAAGIAPLYLP